MGFNTLTKMKIIPIIFLIAFCTSSVYASLKPEDFITPDDLMEDMSTENYTKILADRLATKVLSVGHTLQSLVNSLNTYAESGIIYDKNNNITSYSKSHVAALYIIRAIDRVEITLEACYAHSLQMKFSEGYNKYIMYETNVILFEKYYLPILQTSAATIGHNLGFIENKNIKDKTMDALSGVEKLFNAYFDYMEFLIK